MRKTFWLAVLAALSFALVACGADDEEARSDPVSKAAAATTDAGTARSSFELVLRIPEVDKPVRLDGEGIDDYENKRGRLVVDASSILDAVPDLDLPGFVRLKVELIYDDDTLYVKLPFAALKTGKEWIRIRPESPSGKRARFDGLTHTSPADFLRVLRATSGSITTVGQEDVRGIPTTHYRAMIDVKKAVELVPEEERDAARAAISEIERAVGATVPVDVWVDDDDLVRRLKGDLSVRMEGEGFGVAFTIEFFDFGADVDVDIPDENDVDTSVIPFVRFSGSTSDY